MTLDPIMWKRSISVVVIVDVAIAVNITRVAVVMRRSLSHFPPKLSPIILIYINESL